MATEFPTRASKRLKLSNEAIEKINEALKSPETKGCSVSGDTSVSKTAQAETTSTTCKDDVVVISSSSSDEDSDKTGKDSNAPSIKQETKQGKEQESARTVDDAVRKLVVSEPCQETSKSKLTLLPKKKLQSPPNPEEKKQPLLPKEPSKVPSAEPNKPACSEIKKAPVLKRGKNYLSDSDSDEVISQEDLLAQLGLSSVKELNKKEAVKGSVSSVFVSSKTERKPLFSHRPKESIIEMLKVPRMFDPHKGKKNGDSDAGTVNGVKGDEFRSESADESSDEEEDSMKSKEKLISRLRNELRNEEAKLLLLKKIQAAQNDIKVSVPKSQKENIVSKAPVPIVPQHGLKLTNQITGKKSQPLPPPPPLKTSSSSSGAAFNPQRILPKAGSQPTTQSSMFSKFTVATPPSSNSDKQSSAIKNLQIVVSSMTNLIQPSPIYARSGSQGNSPLYTAPSQPAPVRPTPVRANTHSTNSGYVSFQQHLPLSSHHSVTSSSGKQAAAKMALRKQLERTLLQIPPPKPPPPEWSFIPSLNSPEFMSLVGMEQVVNGLAAKASKAAPLEEKVPENPKVCSQCCSDFTPTWKKREGGVIVCEKCSTLNVKKELKAEHTSRLKQAFLKALKQEQEIEQKMSDTSPIAPKPQTQRTSTQPLPTHHHLAHHQLHHHHQSVQPRLYHHHQPPPHSESLLFQLQQQHLQQQQQEIEAARRQADVRWHPYLGPHRHSTHKTQHHHTYMSDSDRQYLLDMIPSLPAPTLGYGSSRL